MLWRREDYLVLKVERHLKKYYKMSLNYKSLYLIVEDIAEHSVREQNEVNHTEQT